MCSSAERVLNECQKHLDFEIDPWRKPGFCELNCGENFEDRPCGPRGKPDKERQTTCINEIQGTHPGSESYCSEACYCAPGFVLEGRRCIPPSSCGCILEGVYIAVGDTFMNFNCTSLLKCISTGTTEQEQVTCDPNAGCFLKEDTGVFGCHCKDGYIGDGITCGNDICFNKTCPENMECNRDNNAECQCKKGYIGDCTKCEDIDECQTRTDDCIHIGQNCTNTIGSYRCHCIPGFVPYGNYCVDVDECEAGFDNCDANAECINTHGSFICECCEGYDMGAGGTCIANAAEKVTAVGGKKCCSCRGDGCFRAGQVCGSDGITYTTERKLIVEACRTAKFIEVNYRGACKVTCTGVVCDKPYEECAVDPILNLAQCICPKCGSENSPVCSTRLLLFQNDCEFRRISCEVNDDNSTIHTDVRLCDKASGSPFSAWTEWSTCSVDCGPGEMVRSRTEIRTQTAYELTLYALDETAICYGNCSDAPCFNYTCPGYGQICIPSPLMPSVPECICPNCTFREDAPICGLLGYRQVTFKNRCELQKKACEVNRRYHVLSNSPCGTLPLNCSLYTQYQDLSDGTCVGEPVPVGICEGGCGVMPDKCCEADETEMASYNLMCANGTTLVRQISSVLSCKCNDLAHTT
ncbi:fibrillin-2 isoform X2 [Patella vulgata]|nr:fibrillin-2 isoform X2 [Patella vulgata]